MRYYDPIGELVRLFRAEPSGDYPGDERLQSDIRSSPALVVLLHPEEGPWWVFGDDASLLLDGRRRRLLDVQVAAALGGYRALEGVEAPLPYVGFYLDVASRPYLLPLGGSCLLVRLPGIIAWDIPCYLSLAPLWPGGAGEEADQRLRRVPFLPPPARRDRDVRLSAWAQAALTVIRTPLGAPLRYAIIEGLPPPPLPPGRSRVDVYRKAIEEQVYGQGVHSRKARRGFVPLEEHDTPVHHEMVDAIGLRQAIEKLPPHLREAVLLVYVEGLTQREAARSLGVTQQALSKRLQQALRLLKAALS